MDTWFALIASFFFHVLLFKDRYDKHIESIKTKIKLSKKEAQIHNLVQAMPEGVLVMDYNKTVLLENKAYKFYVTDFSKLHYKNRFLKFSENEEYSIESDLKEFFQSNEQKIVFGSVKEKDYILEVTATKIIWESDNAAILTFRNVTSLIQLETKIAEDYSVNETLRGISHELKTPLHVIINKLRSIYEKVPDYNDEIDISIKMAKFLLSSIRNIIDYSSIKFNSLVPQEVGMFLLPTVKKCISICRTCQFTGIISVNLDLNPQLPEYIITDKSRFKQVLIALINKAAG